MELLGSFLPTNSFYSPKSRKHSHGFKNPKDDLICEGHGIVFDAIHLSTTKHIGRFQTLLQESVKFSNFEIRS